MRLPSFPVILRRGWPIDSGTEVAPKSFAPPEVLKDSSPSVEEREAVCVIVRDGGYIGEDGTNAELFISFACQPF
jgi:hypothetical protein